MICSFTMIVVVVVVGNDLVVIDYKLLK